MAAIQARLAKKAATNVERITGSKMSPTRCRITVHAPPSGSAPSWSMRHFRTIWP